MLLSTGASAVEVAPLLLASAAPGDTAAVAALRAAAEELAVTQPAAPWSPIPCCGCMPPGARGRLRPWPHGSSGGRCRRSRRRRSG